MELLEFSKRKEWPGMLNVLHWAEQSHKRKKCPTTNASISPIEKYGKAFPSLSFLEKMDEGRVREKCTFYGLKFGRGSSSVLSSLSKAL